jgi:DNA-directed RNA polymerase subunit E'
MYKIVTIEDKIRVGPEKLTMPKKAAVMDSISDKYESILEPKLGVVLAVVGVDKVGEGKIFAGDAGVHYMTTFKILAYKPELQETVYGEVIDNTEFGAFVRMGPMDGLVHISQLMDDYVSYDNKSSMFLGKESKRTLKKGDKVRARIISISFTDQHKIGLTMRQAGLGCLTWINEDRNKRAKESKK